MINFKQLHTNIMEDNEGKNLHMLHIEDLIIYGGVNGARDAILGLRSMRDMLAGHSNENINTTVKWDGAPAIICGYVPPGNPNEGKFFVAKKGLFNKTPKYYTTMAEIDADVSGDLAFKFKVCLANLSKVVIGKDIYQGDLLFTKSDLKRMSYDGVNYVTFQPNTIVYAIPMNEGGDELTNMDMGIVFHTRYSGSNNFESMKASFNVSSYEFKKSPKVFLRDASLYDITGSASMNKSASEEVTAALSFAGKLFNTIASTTLKQLEQNRDLATMIETFNNTYVRRGEPVVNTSKHVDNLIKWIEQKYQKQIDSLKTVAAKDRRYTELNNFLSFFSKENKENLKRIFDLQNAIIAAKNIVINKLDELNKTKTFIKTPYGYKVTGSEGYVIVDHINGKTVKLVNRLEFSHNNFNPEVLKGWQSV